MAIQFHCANCGQPIEVDQEHAGRTAACPYCQSMIRVPTESTLASGGVVAARPGPDLGSTEALTPPPPLPGYGASTGLPGLPAGVPALEPRRAAARVWGNFGLIAGVLGITLMVVLFLTSAAAFGKRLSELQREYPDPKALSEALQTKELQAEFQGNPWIATIAGLSCGTFFFSIVGLVLGIVSLVQSRARNWRGWVSVLLGSVFFGCFCFALIINLASGGMGS